VTREVPSDDLVANLSAMNEPWARRVVKILSRQGFDKVICLDAVPADQLHRIYSVRLAAQQDGSGPKADNLNGFVHALEQPGMVELFSVKDSTETWIIILRDGIAVSYVRLQPPESNSAMETK
jgi:hypothetical protein